MAGKENKGNFSLDDVGQAEGGVSYDVLAIDIGLPEAGFSNVTALSSYQDLEKENSALKSVILKKEEKLKEKEEKLKETYRQIYLLKKKISKLEKGKNNLGKKFEREKLTLTDVIRCDIRIIDNHRSELAKLRIDMQKQSSCMNELKKLIITQEEEMMCRICITEKINAVLICGHEICYSCAKKVEGKCPFCRKESGSQIIQLFGHPD